MIKFAIHITKPKNFCYPPDKTINENSFLKLQKEIASSRIRTDDLVITSDAPYQLGHQGICWKIKSPDLYVDKVRK